MIPGTVESKLLNKRPSLGEAMLDCVPITVDDNSTNLPPPSYGSIPPSRGGRTSPFPYGQMGPSRGVRTQDEAQYGTLPPSRGGRFSEETYYGVVPPSRGGRISPGNYAAPPFSRGGRTSPSYGSSASRFARAKTIDINTATLELLSTATQTEPYLLPARSRLE